MENNAARDSGRDQGKNGLNVLRLAVKFVVVG
jgi:hypothetical protein